MEALLFLIPAVACGLIMVVCMTLMSRMRDHGESTEEGEVAALRDEVARLRAQLDRDPVRGDG